MAVRALTTTHGARRRADYEDLIGDLPTRFKYRQVDASGFGITDAEMLQV